MLHNISDVFVMDFGILRPTNSPLAQVKKLQIPSLSYKNARKSHECLQTTLNVASTRYCVYGRENGRRSYSKITSERHPPEG